MYITTYRKIHFEPLQPRAENIRIEDIAHAQSLMTRANGHFPEFYSVAQHSLACAEEAEARGCEPRLILACLLHDASEVYISDITRPVKSVLTQYREIEKKLQDAVFECFLGSTLCAEEGKLVQEIDDACLYYEFIHYMGERLMTQEPVMVKKPVFGFREFREVEKEFLQTFYRYADSN